MPLFREGKKHSMSSDSQIVCHGKLVISQRPPDRFHRGWYPIRNCVQKPTLTAGVRTFKETYFQNYHVICKICDAPRNKKKGCPKNGKKIDCSSSSLVSCSSSTLPRLMNNAHWRQHDPHLWMDNPQICSNAKVHKTNWFGDGVKKEAIENAIRRLNKQRERKNMHANKDCAGHAVNNTSDHKESKLANDSRPSSDRPTAPSNQAPHEGSQDKSVAPKDEQQT